MMKKPYRRFTAVRGWLTCLLLATALPTNAEHALGLGQAPHYAAEFTHFGYTNPAAPKGGSFNLPWPGGFDTLNPFTLKGDKEIGITMLTLDTLMTCRTSMRPIIWHVI